MENCEECIDEECVSCISPFQVVGGKCMNVTENTTCILDNCDRCVGGRCVICSEYFTLVNDVCEIVD